MTQSVKADVEINATTFPDDNFRAWVLAKVAGASDGTLTDAEIAKVKSIYCYTQSIADLTGIQYFTELTTLNCSSNNLTSLDVSALTKLTTLTCSFNQLTSLSTPNSLVTLHCHRNKLNSLVLTSTNLEDLRCNNNNLTSLDLSNFTKLKTLRCGENKLTSLDVSNCTLLTLLYCQTNSIVSLDVSNLHVLTDLICSENPLSSLKLPTDPSALQSLNCGYSNLSSIDNLNDQSNLQLLDIYSCQFESIDVSALKNLQTLNAPDNNISSLDLTGLSNLSTVRIENNDMSSLTLSGNDALTVLITAGNPKLDLIDTSGAPNLVVLTNSSTSGAIVSLDNNKYGIGVANSFDAANVSSLTVGGDNYTPEVVEKDSKKYLVVADNVTENKAIGTVAFTYNGNNISHATGAFVVPVTSAGMATMNFTGDVTIPEGVEAFYCGSIDANTAIVLAYNISGAIPANTPVFVVAPAGTYLFSKSSPSETHSLTKENILVGTTAVKSVAPREVLTLGHDSNGRLGFNYFTGTEIPAYKAYIPADKVSASTSEARTFRVLFDESETTGISKLVEVKKVEDDVIYNLAGQRVNAVSKGIFIKNGKKFIVK